MVRERGEAATTWVCIHRASGRRLRHWLRIRERCTASNGGLAEADAEVRLDDTPNQNATAELQQAEHRSVEGRKHLRLSRAPALLGEVTQGELGRPAQDFAETAAAHDARYPELLPRISACSG